jgi:Tfp pilus assembly protein PilF
MPKAEAAARKAIVLDSRLVEAHAALGLVLHHYRWEWEEAEKEYSRALALNRNHAATHIRYSWLLAALGRHAEALEKIERAREILREVDPRRLVVIHATRALAFSYARQYREATEECRRGLALDPSYIPLHFLLARAAAGSGKREMAFQTLRRAEAAHPPSPLLLTAAGYAATRVGQTALARARLDALQKLSGKRYVPATYFGILAGALGQKDDAFKWLERGVKERADGLTWLKVDPAVDSLRSDPRFSRLLRKIGLG